MKALEPLIVRLTVMLLAAAYCRLVLHMAPCTGRAEVMMAFYRNPFLPVKCSVKREMAPKTIGPANQITIGRSLLMRALLDNLVVEVRDADVGHY